MIKTIFFAKLCFFAFAYVLYGCSSVKHSSADERISVKSQPLHVGASLKRSYAIDVAGNYIVVRDDQERTKLTLFDLEEDAIRPIYTGYFGGRIGEILNPGPIVTDMDRFLLLDGTKRKLLAFEFDSLKTTEYRPKGSISVKQTSIIDMKKISADLFLAVGLFPENRFILLDGEGSTVGKLGDYPIPLSENMEDYIRWTACQSMITTNPEKNIAATAMRYGEHIQFHSFNLEQQTAQLISEHNVFLPEFTTGHFNGTPNFKPTEQTRWGYISITSTTDFVYALFSGKRQIQGTNFNKGREVHVFDWQGNLVKRLKLDRETFSISCSQSQLYGLYGGESGYEIARYQL